MRRWLLAGAVAAVLLALGAGALLLGRDGGTSEATGVVPSVVGLTEQAAEERLVARGYSTQVVRRRDERPEGTVVAQQPAGGRALDGGVVVIVVSGAAEGGTGTASSDEREVVALPRVTGKHQILAGAELEQRGLVTDSFPVANDADCGTVLRQEPAAGARVAPGTHVRLTVSLGPDPLPETQVPGLTGLAAAARTAAREFGFTVRTVEQPGPAAKTGIVLRQEPGALSTAPELSQITLYVGG